MSPETLVWWSMAAALAVVLVLTAIQVVRAFGALQRLGARVEALADLPVIAALERADADSRRIDAAIAALPALLERGKGAVAIIRRGPLPIELVVAIGRARAEIAAFRKFAGR